MLAGLALRVYSCCAIRNPSDIEVPPLPVSWLMALSIVLRAAESSVRRVEADVNVTTAKRLASSPKSKPLTIALAKFLIAVTELRTLPESSSTRMKSIGTAHGGGDGDGDGGGGEGGGSGDSSGDGGEGDGGGGRGDGGGGLCGGGEGDSGDGDTHASAISSSTCFWSPSMVGSKIALGEGERVRVSMIVCARRGEGHCRVRVRVRTACTCMCGVCTWDALEAMLVSKPLLTWPKPNENTVAPPALSVVAAAMAVAGVEWPSESRITTRPATGLWVY